MKSFRRIGMDIGELVERKNAAYGSSFARAGEFLRLLYPNGLQPAQYADALLLVRIFDKQMRVATDRDALGESPYADIAGYGILGAHLHQPEHPEKEATSPWQDSVNGPDAAGSSPASSTASATQSTAGRTTTSAAAKSGPPASPPPAGCCSTPDIPSTSSQPSADGSPVRLPAATQCTQCHGPLERGWMAPDNLRPERFCSVGCANLWKIVQEMPR